MSITCILCLSGCLSSDERGGTPSPPNTMDSLPPHGIIDAPVQGYFGDEILFDASTSFDPDGSIASYTWIFGDDTTANGTTVNHVFSQDSSTPRDTSPITYEIVLEVIDNENLVNYTVHYLYLYQPSQTLYLDTTGLSYDIPQANAENLRASLGLSSLNPITSMTYMLSSPLSFQPGTWEATFFLEKPLLCPLTGFTLRLLNTTGGVIDEQSQQFPILSLWKEKTISVTGILSQQGTFSSLSMAISGFSLTKSISLHYGGTQASQITFKVSL
jgi:hypothetical protein